MKCEARIPSYSDMERCSVRESSTQLRSDGQVSPFSGLSSSCTFGIVLLPHGSVCDMRVSNVIYTHTQVY